MKFYSNFSIILVLCVLLGVAEKTFAVKLEGFDVQDGSIAAKHLPAFLDDPNVADLVGSVDAYYIGQKQNADEALRESFPDGDPLPALRIFAYNLSTKQNQEENEALRELLDNNPLPELLDSVLSFTKNSELGAYRALLKNQANYARLAKKLKKSVEMSDFIVQFKSLTVQLAQAVEANPSQFVFCDPNTLEKMRRADLHEFPFTAWGHPLQKKMEFFRKIAQNQFVIYNAWFIEDFSSMKRERILQQLAETPELTALVSRETLGGALNAILDVELMEKYSLEKMANAVLVMENIVPKFLTMMRTIQEEATAQKAQETVAPAQVSPTA